MAAPATVHSSPRLPSPPPFTEVQVAPNSPHISTTSPTKSLSPSSSSPSSSPPPPSSLSGSSPASSSSSSSPSTRRIRPGTKSANVTTGAPLTLLSEVDSAFQLQEHLASLLASITSPPGSTRTFPLSRDDCQRLATPPDGVEESLWCYELIRRLTRDLNVLIVALLADRCTAQSCPEMRASEWQYLCAVHESPQSCCAIDYSTHTLDQAATMLTSTKYFPSRLSLHQGSMRHLASIFRRLYRIFAHAWFQHRHVFWEVEGEHGLYLFFKTVSDRYRLIPPDNMMLPPEAEGLGSDGNGVADAGQGEDDFDEWARGTHQPRTAAEDDEEDEEVEGDDDDEEDGNYSDESESDEDIGDGDDGDGEGDDDDDDNDDMDVIGEDGDGLLQQAEEKECEAAVKELSEETMPPGDIKQEGEGKEGGEGEREGDDGGEKPGAVEDDKGDGDGVTGAQNGTKDGDTEPDVATQTTDPGPDTAEANAVEVGGIEAEGKPEEALSKDDRQSGPEAAEDVKKEE